MKAKEGRVDDIRICPACMSCSDQLATNNPITCAINPEAGRESELKIKPAPRRRRCWWSGQDPPAWKRHGLPVSAVTRSFCAKKAIRWVDSSIMPPNLS